MDRSVAATSTKRSRQQFSATRQPDDRKSVIRVPPSPTPTSRTPPPLRNTLHKLLGVKAWVDPGPVIKVSQPKDRGKAYAINKRTSHLVVTVDERAEGEVSPKFKSVGARPGKARQ